MTQLGRYEILQQLATGPVADVLLARAKGLEGFTRHVVVKQIRPELGSDERFVHAFLNEARIAASLHHQNIVQVYDIDEDHGRYYFAMEYVHGEDVRKLLLRVREEGTLVPLDQIVAIGAAAAAGLHHAHEQVDANRSPLGLVHRDVSPGNILIGYDGGVKLVDFGLAKPALSSAKTRTGSIAGKAPYMSPELCQGKAIDRRSDIFALGIVLYELATAKRLFKGDNDYLTMAAIVDGDVAPPSAHRRDIPRALDEIIMRALAKLPAARFQTAMDLRAHLESFAIEAELRTSSKALADYMIRMFGARAEPWLDEAKHARAIDSEGDFDESSLGLVLAPPGSIVTADANAPISIARGAAGNAFENDALPTHIDARPQPEEEPTATATATLTVAEMLAPATIDLVTPPVPQSTLEAPTARGLPKPRTPASASAPPPPRRTTTPPASVPLRTSSSHLPSVAGRTTLPPPILPSAKPTPVPPPAILGTPNQPAPAVRSRSMAPTGFEDDDIDDAGADAPTTVQPPMIFAPHDADPPTIRAMPPPAPIAMTPMMAMAPMMARPPTQSGLHALYGKPPWLRYLIVALGLAIPMAVGFGSRACSHAEPAALAP
nr:protein kinase [Kofleriaceae bacterium]